MALDLIQFEAIMHKIHFWLRFSDRQREFESSGFKAEKNEKRSSEKKRIKKSEKMQKNKKKLNKKRKKENSQFTFWLRH